MAVKMSNVTPLHNEAHKSLKVIESQDFSRFKDQHLIPLVVQDFGTVATEFPIVFVKNNDSGQFVPVALMGLREGVNIYCQEKTWKHSVLPRGFKNAPFSLARKADAENELIVCIDIDSELVSETDGNALFDDAGEQTDYLKARSEAVGKVAEFNQQTQTITQHLASLDLIASRQLTVNLEKEGQPLNINGLYLIDEKVLNELPADKFEDLRSKGLLTLIYAQINSIHQVGRLTAKQNAFDKS